MLGKARKKEEIKRGQQNENIVGGKYEEQQNCKGIKITSLDVVFVIDIHLDSYPAKRIVI
jgi:hypothetical protein